MATLLPFFLTSAYPARSIQELASRTPLHLLPLDEKTIAALTRKHPLIAVTIPKNTYVGLDRSVATVGVTAMIVTHRDVEDRTVISFLDRLFGDVGGLSKFSTHAGSISVEKAKTGVSIPFHPAAAEYGAAVGGAAG